LYHFLLHYGKYQRVIALLDQVSTWLYEVIDLGVSGTEHAPRSYLNSSWC